MKLIPKSVLIVWFNLIVSSLHTPLVFSAEITQFDDEIAPLTVVTENMPPLQIANKDSSLDGFATEVVLALLQQMKQPTDITVMNWARAYQLAQIRENVMIFSITRNPVREDLFKWVGSILTLENHIWHLSYRDKLKITSIEQAKSARIAVPRDDIQHHYLVKQGFEPDKGLILVPQYEQAINLLLRERVEYFAGSNVFLFYRLKQLGVNVSAVKPTLKLDNSISTLYIAFSKQTDDKVVETFRQGLSQLKKSQTYQDILNKWQIQISID